MTVGVAAVLFVAGSAVSLASSWIVVSRIERVGNRLGASEALLGLISALAANAPEITSSVSALLQHRGAVSAGVVIGSNVFNLAALLGLGSVVAGAIALNRNVVLYQGAVAVWVAIACLLDVTGAVSTWVALLLVALVLLPYTALSALDSSRWWRRPDPSSVRRWLTRAIAEEELALSATIHPRRGRAGDALVGVGGLVVVVGASVMMERSASRLGVHFDVSGMIVGGIVLAAVTSLPNAVAAIYWAKRGRAVAMLSTALNSNALNVALGLLLPALIVGIGRGSPQETQLAGWYLGLTVAVLIAAYIQRGLRRPTGWLVIAAYVAFAALLAAAS